MEILEKSFKTLKAFLKMFNLFRKMANEELCEVFV